MKSTYILKGSAFSDRIYEDDACSSLVIGLSDISESFLASCVPNLKFDPLILNSHGFNFEIYSNRGDVVWLKGVFAEADKHVGLAYPAISDNDEFENLVFLLGLHHLIIYVCFPTQKRTAEKRNQKESQ